MRGVTKAVSDEGGPRTAPMLASVLMPHPSSLIPLDKEIG